MKTPLNPKEVAREAIRSGALIRADWEAHKLDSVTLFPRVKLPEEVGLSPARIARPEPVPRVLRNKKRECGRPGKYVISQREARARGLIK